MQEVGEEAICEEANEFGCQVFTDEFQPGKIRDKLERTRIGRTSFSYLGPLPEVTAYWLEPVSSAGSIW
jgi:hypothetical protein